jgi:membrane protease subunit (stomatin/prohibitin family)
MIYTNNQGPKEWAYSIISYFENKIKYKLFDQIISAFKINGKRVEICRTQHDKCHKDFIKCTKLPTNAEICFIDDSYYPEMTNNNIYYINLKPYYYDLNFEEMIARFNNSWIGVNLIKNADEFNEYMINEFKKYNYEVIEKNKDEYEIEEILGKQIMDHLEEFFNIKNKNMIKKTNGTRKNTLNRKNKTHKQF